MTTSQEPQDPIEKRVMDESRLFEAALPQLLRQYLDKWVVFFHGTVTGAFDDEDEALRAAVALHGRRSGFIVVQVTETACDPVALSASLFFVPSAQ